MKHPKSARAALLVLAVSAMACLLTACGETAQSVVKKEAKAYQNAPGVGDMRVSVVMDAVTYSSQSSSSQAGSSIKMQLEETLAFSVEPHSASGTVASTTETAGAAYRTGSDYYEVLEDGKTASYLQSEGNWYRTEGEEPRGDVLSNTEFQTKLAELDRTAMTMEKKKVTVNDTACWQLNATLNGELIKDLVDSNILDMSGFGVDPNTADWSSCTADLVLFVNAKTYLPVRLTVDLAGLEGAMNSMLAAGSTGESLEIKEYSATLDYLSFEPHEAVTVPQEVKDSAAFTAQLENGDFNLANPDQWLIYEAGLSGQYHPVVVEPFDDLVIYDGGYDHAYLQDWDGEKEVDYTVIRFDDPDIGEQYPMEQAIWDYASNSAFEFGTQLGDALGTGFQLKESEQGQTYKDFGVYQGVITCAGVETVNYYSAWLPLDADDATYLFVEGVFLPGAYTPADFTANCLDSVTRYEDIAGSAKTENVSV